ncbi:MAG: trypsin-like serine protease, partial [Polyangiaceae bacterium]|nr:trypsin-like serine protease [Polyangiaceae bacterium]
MRARFLLAFFLLCTVPVIAGCLDSTPSFGGRFEELIEGLDDRREPYESDDPAFAARALEVSVALVHSGDVTADGSGHVTLAGTPLADWVEGAQGAPLCPDERYATQPSSAFCSGALVAPDLVLTAGHCVRTQAACDDTALVFGFAMEAPGVLA